MINVTFLRFAKVLRFLSLLEEKLSHLHTELSVFNPRLE